uniref:Replication protein n=2 Tax=Thermococcus sp. IRI33 TaxID=1197733 RepID=L0BAF2_9EURY|nr:Replication protein [Thermococcus sp. IRI33]
MEGELKHINNLPSPNRGMVLGTDPETKGQGLRNPYREVLEALDLWEARNPKAGKVTVAELRELGASPIARMTIKDWILSFKVPDEELLELPEEKVREKINEIPVSVEALRKKAEEEALKWDLEHSNNLYHRYKLLKEKKVEFELLRSKVKWADFGEKRKILVLAHYIMEALKQDTNMVTLANLRKPGQFYYLDKGRKIRFNELAFNGFVKELGLDPEEPITGEDLAVILVRRFGYTEESLKGFYEEIVRDLIKPSRMRLPPCIEAIAFRPLFYDTKKGRIIDEGLKVLASWFKYYARGYTTGRIQGGKDKKVLLFEFLLSKLYGDVIDVTEQAEILQRFKKFYEEAKPFRCGMVQEVERATSFKICSLKCPFVAPINRIEEALASVEEVNLYGADFIEIKAGDNKFMEPYSSSLTPRSKLVQKFAGFLSVLYADPLIKPEEALEILEALLERARIVQNYLSPLVAVEEWFREEMERLLEDGALPWELKAKDKPFLAKNGKGLYVHRDLIVSDLMGAVGLEGYTARKLIEDLKRLPNSPIAGVSTPIEVKKDSYTDDKTKARFWIIRVKWLEEHGIEVRVKIPTLEEPKTEEPKKLEEDLKDLGVNLTPLEKLILEATGEPKDITELIELGEKARKSEEEVTTAVARLMHLGFLEMKDGAKLQRTVGVGPNE